MNTLTTRKGTIVQDPPFIKLLLNDKRAAWGWLIVRLWLGYKWLDAGWHKVGEEAWTGGGMALKGYWERAVIIPETGRAAISFDWYRSFIQFLLDIEAYTWFAKLVAYGEVLIGIALILGLFTGIAAFAGGFMNWNFMMAGSASTNPMLFVVALGLVMAWKVAGFIGLDYFALPALGTPWSDLLPEEVEEAKPALA
ncbi:MAG TPA: DoxX family membrane protein [Anaerolineae bacterium]|nr:DoxX family membrane protein [Anaerolineae bacterium]